MSVTGRFLASQARQTGRRSRALWIAWGLGITALLVSAALAGSSVAASAQRLDEASDLSALELLSVSPAGEPTQLTASALAAIASLDPVEEVVGAASVGVTLEPADDANTTVPTEAFGHSG